MAIPRKVVQSMWDTLNPVRPCTAHGFTEEHLQELVTGGRIAFDKHLAWHRETFGSEYLDAMSYDEVMEVLLWRKLGV